MPRYNSNWQLVGLLAFLLTGCSSSPQTQSGRANESLAWELASSSRPQADRDRDADRKPVQLMMFFGVERGMVAVDLMAGGGFMTEVLSVAVGPSGKVYAHNQTTNKALMERLADNRLPNVVRVEGGLSSIPPDSVDVLVTVMNLHDVYNSAGSQAVVQALKGMSAVLKPGGVFGVVDHVGLPDANNAQLHRMTQQQAIEVVTAAGFVLEAESDLLASSSDDHTKIVTDASLRGRTDQFILRFRKPE